MNRTLISVTCAIIAVTVTAQIIGKWTGDLHVQGMHLPIVFNFSASDNTDSLPQCTMDSPAQNAFGITTDVTFCSADSLSLRIAGLGVRYTGCISGDTVRGTFSQGFVTLPMDLIRSHMPVPIEPESRPYTEQELEITTPDSITLSATLTVPANASAARRVPVAVLVSGSGPQNRDEEVFGLKPFAVLADSLARGGIAALRYDDRGTARSGGDFAQATTLTFASDASAVLATARELDFAACAGIIGHSEGGLVAFMLGAAGEADFVISLAGPGLKGTDVLTAQNLRALRKSGFSGNLTDSLAPVVREMMLQASHSGQLPDGNMIADSLRITLPAILAADFRGKAGQPTGAWLQEFLRTDPAVFISRTGCPALALNGSLDTQVDAESNIAAIRRANPDVRTEILPGLNHMFQKAATGDSSEYALLGDPFQSGSIAIMIGFIKNPR